MNVTYLTLTTQRHLGDGAENSSVTSRAIMVGLLLDSWQQLEQWLAGHN